MKAPLAILHTPPGSGGIAVILLTGRAAAIDGILRQMASRPISPDDHRLFLSELRDEQGRLDEAIITCRAGEDVGSCLAEINIHGGPRITQRVLQRLAQLGANVGNPSTGIPAAHPWPLEAPGLANAAIGRELLDALGLAKTRFVATFLANQWSAGISALGQRALDNPGEASLPVELRAAAGRLPLMRRLLEPAEIVLAGPPNAGKSSLANALLGRQACIVTDVPGTTRDWVRELADLAGCPAYLTDTAGLWETDNPLDAQAVHRAWQRVEQADLVLAVFDCTQPPADTTWQRLVARPNAVPVANKIDLASVSRPQLGVSASTGEGLEELRRVVRERLGVGEVDATLPAAFTPRQADLLNRLAEALKKPDSHLVRQLAGELLAGAK